MRSPPGAVHLSTPSEMVALKGTPGFTASRVKSPELAMSWWKFGHELGEQAEAGVVYTDTVPWRVIETASFFAESVGSRVPSDPSVGVAPCQSPVSFYYSVFAGSPSM